MTVSLWDFRIGSDTNRCDIFSCVHATLQPALYVRRSVRLSNFSFFYFFRRLRAVIAYCSCPKAWLALLSCAPAHPHATKVAVYPALFLGSGPEGVDDLCFHTYGEFSPSPPPPPSPSYPPLPQSPGPYFSLDAHIPASRPKPQS